jgi:hypothetical protein
METGIRRSRSRVPAGGDRAPGALPNVIVIGAQKCGTSGLHYYLGLHPEVSVSVPKELNFFIAERNWERGVEWYRSRFDPAAPVRVDASPNYTAYPQFKGVPERMAGLVPDARLIYLVRDPIDRIAAHWVHNYAKGRHDGELTDTILNPKASYLSRSRYAMQLERFLEHYPAEQVLVVDQMDLRADRDRTLGEIFEFAGARADFRHRGFAAERHKTERKTRATALGRRLEERRARSRRTLVPDRAWAVARNLWPLGAPIDRPDVAAALPGEAIELLREDARRLEELTGRSFPGWSVWEL